jgi:hypothetical protein
VRVSGGHFHRFSTPFFGHHLAALNYATKRTFRSFFAHSLKEIKLSIAGCKVCNLIPMAFLVLEIFYKRVPLLGKIMPSPDKKEVFVIQWKFV